MSSPPTSKRQYAGFWSSARSFNLPVGPHIDRAGVRGYPIDMRVKAEAPIGLPPRARDPRMLHVATCQYGLACWEHWLTDSDDAWLQSALAVGRFLVAIQEPDGSWMHHAPYPHTFSLAPPWASAIAQGQGASLLVRLHGHTGEDELAAAAQRALRPMLTPQSEGGVGGELDGRPWPEEYPTTPQSHVLNGAMFALWGMRDVAVGLESADAGAHFERGIDALAANLHRYDTGSWSLYSLYPHPILNRASSFYHDLHINQLTAMMELAPRPEFDATRRRWERYATSRVSLTQAFAWKAAFRLLVPRNRLFARAAPWTRT